MSVRAMLKKKILSYKWPCIVHGCVWTEAVTLSSTVQNNSEIPPETQTYSSD